MKTRNGFEIATVYRKSLQNPEDSFDWTNWLEDEELGSSKQEILVYNVSNLGVNFEDNCSNCECYYSLYSLSEVEKLETISSSNFDSKIPF